MSAERLIYGTGGEGASPARPAHATALVAPRELHMEILDTTNRNVWQTIEPISLQEYKAVVLDPPWVKVGVGASVFDEHWFDRSPDAAESGAMAVRDIGGRGFALCARAPADGGTLPAGPDGPRRLLVEKHHVVRYRAGRTVSILSTPDAGEYVHVVESGIAREPLVLPPGWRVRSLELAADWIVPLPVPTTAYFFANRDGYQGPLSVLPDGSAARL